MAVSPEVELIEPSFGRPHLFILGAGASRAALPTGDMFGRKIPLMDDLAEVLEVGKLLAKYGIRASDPNFEALYSDLHQSQPGHPVLQELESAVRNYFAGLRLPPEPNIYDYLILSLREKDFIATFNWDPFLLEAAERNARIGSHPHLAFLHGCASLGICDNHRLKAPIPGRCPKCSEKLRPSRLLFPVRDKDYDADPHISGEWSGFEAALQGAYILTIFGFGAPATDAKAFSIMQAAWSKPGVRDLEETEIIDILPRNDLKARWDPFIVRYHYQIRRDFFETMVSSFPRRSCEAFFNRVMLLKIAKANQPPREMNLVDLQNWFRPLIEAENSIAA